MAVDFEECQKHSSWLFVDRDSARDYSGDGNDAFKYTSQWDKNRFLLEFLYFSNAVWIWCNDNNNVCILCVFVSDSLLSFIIENVHFVTSDIQEDVYHDENIK